MKKILYAASSWIHIQNFHLPYIRELEHEGHTVHVTASGMPRDVEITHPVHVAMKKRVFSLRNMLAVLFFIRLLRQERYDIIYVHTTLAAFLMRAARMLSGQKSTLIYLCHGYFFSLNKGGRLLLSIPSLIYFLCEKLLAPFTDTLVLMNRSDFDAATRYHLCRDIRFVHGMGLVPEQNCAAPRKEPFFLCVGEFSQRKNQSEVIRAFAIIAPRFPEAHLLLAGCGKTQQKIRRLARNLCVESRVDFLGYVSDVPALYSRAAALVSASRSEGLPFCVMESLHFGTPVISSDIKGHADLIQSGVNGLLHPLGDAESLSQNMADFLGSAALRESLRANAKLPPEYYFENVLSEHRAFLPLG